MEPLGASLSGMPTVMWVDDDADLLWMMSRQLARDGFSVKTFEHAPTWEQLQRSRPAVIFLDVELGEEDGLEVCDRIKHDGRSASIPIILVSSHAAERLKAAAATCGADGYLSKPFDPVLILELARHYAHIQKAS